MSKIYRDHCTEVVIDLGCIGEHYADVFYNWHEANPSNDPYQVPEPGGCEIVDVRVFLDGNEISILHWLSPICLEHISDQVCEKWQ